MGIKTLSQLDLQNKRVILRCDLNVPIKDGLIIDDGRIRASLSTIRKLLAKNCSIVIIAHLGRPKPDQKNDLSLAPVAIRLSELLEVEVVFSEEIMGIKQKTDSLKTGQILLLENIRFLAAETSKDDFSSMARSAHCLRGYEISTRFSSVAIAWSTHEIGRAHV